MLYILVFFLSHRRVLASLLVQKDVGALVFRITSEARVVVHPRETLARAVISFDASTRAFASARLLVSPPGYDGASPSRPDEYLIVVPLSLPRGIRVEDRTSAPGARLVGQALGTARV